MNSLFKNTMEALPTLITEPAWGFPSRVSLEINRMQMKDTGKSRQVITDWPFLNHSWAK